MFLEALGGGGQVCGQRPAPRPQREAQLAAALLQLHGAEQPGERVGAGRGAAVARVALGREQRLVREVHHRLGRLQRSATKRACECGHANERRNERRVSDERVIGMERGKGNEGSQALASPMTNQVLLLRENSEHARKHVGRFGAAAAAERRGDARDRVERQRREQQTQTRRGCC